MKVILGGKLLASSSYVQCGVLSDLHSGPRCIQKKEVQTGEAKLLTERLMVFFGHDKLPTMDGSTRPGVLHHVDG